MKKAVIWVLLVVLTGLVACTPTVPDEPSPQAPTTSQEESTQSTEPPVSFAHPEAIGPQIDASTTAPGKWQTLASGNEVLDLLVDGDDVWAATTGGVVCWNAKDGSYRRYTTLDGLASNTLRKIIRDGQGNIWVTSNVDGVSRFDGASWQTFTTAGSIRTILPGTGDDVWFITEDKRVVHFGGADMQTLPEELPFMPWLGGTLADSGGNLWMATFYTNSGGLHRFNGDKWETFTPEDGLASYQVSGLIEDRDGNIWAVTDSGASYYNGTEWHTFTSEDGLASNNVLCVMEDSKGNIWFGTYGGVSYYSSE